VVSVGQHYICVTTHGQADYHGNTANSVFLSLQEAIETASVVDDKTLMCDLFSVLVRRPYVRHYFHTESHCLYNVPATHRM